MMFTIQENKIVSEKEMDIASYKVGLMRRY